MPNTTLTDVKDYYRQVTEIDIGIVAHELLRDRITQESRALLECNCPNHQSQSGRSLNVMLDKQGWLDEADIEPFLAAGYERRQVMEVVLAISWKTLSNFVNHMADTPLDDMFKEHQWTGEKAA